MDQFASQLPEIAVLSAHIPGNHCPPLAQHSIEVYATALSEILASLGRPAILVGASIGGLVAFAIRSPHLKAIVALDSPLHTGKLWPLVGDFRRRLMEEPDNARLAEFIWNIFGISSSAHEDRDYSMLPKSVTVPTIFMFGDEPLFPERTIDRIPSLTDRFDRDIITQNSHVGMWMIQGAGHNIVEGAWSHIVEAVRRMIKSTSRA